MAEKKKVAKKKRIKKASKTGPTSEQTSGASSDSGSEDSTSESKSVKQEHAEERKKVQDKRIKAVKARRGTRARGKRRKRKRLVTKKMARPPRDIGIDVPPPPVQCQDEHCPFHGTLSVRGQIIKGMVITTKMDRSVVIKREKTRYIPKYERYEKRTRNYSAHRPPCLEVSPGDIVQIMECRPISKTKSFVVVSREV